MSHYKYEVVRSPGVLSFVRLLQSCDVCLCANVSLRAMAPILIARRPFVVSHHGVYDSKKVNLLTGLKKTVARFSTNICCSLAVQSKIPGRSVVVPNTYRSETYKRFDDVVQDLDVIFVGRLVSDKGAADLIDAFGYLRQAGLCPHLSIVGEGPELSTLMDKVKQLQLTTHVRFTGKKRGTDLARYMARHRIMAVPSRWAEPFGVVALEGIACGCVIIGTEQGGLPEAIGPCGVTVPNGDIRALARKLEFLLRNDSECKWYRSRAPEHLAGHSRSTTSRGYLDVLTSVSRS
jgi:glycosyltransferase involved in cell wall biosynthesis